MIKTILIILVFLVLSIFTNAQNQFLFTKQGGLSNNFTSVYENTTNDNIIVTCLSTDYNPSTYYFNSHSSILVINSMGQQIDSISVAGNFGIAGKLLHYNDAYYVYGIEYSNTDFLTGNTYPTILKYDADFNLLKKTRLDTAYNHFSSTIQNTVIINNSLYLAYFKGLGSNTIAKLFKLSLNLDIKDSISFHVTNLNSMIKQGNNLIIAGDGFVGSSPLGRAQAAKLDTTFAVINRFNFDSISNSPTTCATEVGIFINFCNLVEISDTKYYAAGFYPVPYAANCDDDDQAVYAVIENNNKVIKGTSYGVTGGVRESWENFSATADRFGANIYNVCTSDMTDQIIMGTSYTPTSILTAKIDTMGNLIWQKYFNTPNYYYQPMAVCATQDSGVLVCGMRFNTLFPSRKDSMEGFVLKYDKNGNQIMTNTNYLEDFESKIMLFPNPTSNETALTVSLVNESNVSVSIINNVGQVVFVNSASLNAGSNVLNIDTKQFAAGIYNVVISTNNGSVTKKLSVTK